MGEIFVISSSNQNGLLIWKRSLVGGLLSMGIAGTIVVLMYLFNFFPIPLVGFMTVGIIISNFFFGDENLPIIIVSFIFWFFAGSAITYFNKLNSIVIKVWGMLFVASFVLFLLFYVYLNDIL